ncbi:hypothetical protein LINGRAHAP2_LOCUS26174 [Linum grandiflorum]
MFSVKAIMQLTTILAFGTRCRLQSVTPIQTMKPEAAAFLNSLSATASPSSSSRREQSNLPAADSSSQTTGCMSGILRLVSKYHPRNRRRRRFLTFRRPSADNHDQIKTAGPDLLASRSPTLPPEIRRSTDPTAAPPNGRDCSRQVLVARLMGLEDDVDGGDRGSVAAEQRRKLLGALEKCDEDLKVLKEMIEVVTKSGYGGTKSRDPPAPSELDDPSRSPVLSESTRPRQHHHHHKSHASSPGAGGIPRQQKKKPGDKEDGIFFFDTSTARKSPPQPATAVIAVHHHRRSGSESRAMEESVEKACEDIEWGEKREVGRIGFALHDQICKDLVEELVREIVGLYSFNKYYCEKKENISDSYSSSLRQTLPFDSCRRSLHF